MEMARARRHGQQLAVLFIDLDRFKGVNDVHGHEMGDLLLKKVAQRLRDCSESDTVSRRGGDEFTVILGDVRGRTMPRAWRSPSWRRWTHPSTFRT